MTQGTEMKSRIIGLTGPIASGKSEVARILRRHGARVIDADGVGHALLAPQSDAWKEIVRAFGSAVLHPGGTINRKKLGAIVFADRKKLRTLDRIMHPRIKKAIAQRVRELKAENGRPIVVNAAVLKEIGLLPLVDEVWTVIAAKGKRLKRLMKKGLSKDKALKRISSQGPDSAYLRIADRVIRNDGTFRALKKGLLDLLN